MLFALVFGATAATASSEGAHLLDLGELAKIGGLPFALVVIALITGARGDWVYGKFYQQERRDRERAEADRDRLLELCLRFRDNARQGKDVALEALAIVRRPPDGDDKERR